ncbi:MAG: ferritin [Phycisphaeraceae bacterium]|nr:ferritin [Phycisphaeraceae bacterium]
MTIKPVLAEAINQQIQHEFQAAYAYLAMSAWFESHNLAGFAGWMRHQAKEEVEHAMKLFDYLNDRGGSVQLRPVAPPTDGLDSPLGIFRKSLALEQGNTAAIHKLYALAASENDYATQTHLHWFIDEQVEEEKSMQELVDLLALAGENKGMLLMLDHRMAKRDQEKD